MRSPQDILSAILEKPTDLEHVRSLVAQDVTYVSLNYANPDLKRIMPWAGNDAYAAMFGRFTYKSTVLGKTVTSPFAVFARCQNGVCNYLQFMEDTFATGASFRSGGTWSFASNPNGETVVI